MSFSKRHGYEPLPECMRLEYLSEQAKTAVYNIIADIVLVSGNWAGMESFPAPRMCRRAIASCLNKNILEVQVSRDEILDELRSIVYELSFNKALDLLEYMANYQDDQIRFGGSQELNVRLSRFSQDINNAFDEHGVAYVFDTSNRPYHIWPRTSMEQGVTIQNAVATLKHHELSSPVTHLRDAASHLDSRQYSDAITDSIHAVESVVRIFDPDNCRKLSDAVNSLRRRGVLKHQALAEAIKSLYGYTSDEKGIRKALVFDPKANVDINDAMFMFGACASLAAYLANICHPEGES
ncbi:MAG: hypothetical protein F4Z16_11715 [Rhodothermaceae bacterium]|nr:hypothetical protein [Rhodothermaceae bacterium]MYB90290.1 hypothetical protein [Rhodothermaceae bacterium]MYD68534.1 hypothetical protein [Rhodothermaceae bacterium]MYH12477.1 hypothetical protein [Rhodothermaceae bacterium]MYK63212.1 hypothetical protein [Rhodothermaceae bacterium]